MSSKIEIRQGYYDIFAGFPVSVDINIDGIKTYTCYDYLGALDYSIQRPGTISGTATQVVTSLIANHNSQSSVSIIRGNVQQTSNISIEIEYETTLQCLNKLAEQYGGYIQVTPDILLGDLYFDWLLNPGSSFAEAHLGSNILTIAQSIQTDDFGTVLIPVGENGLTISSVNGGLDYLESANSATYGRIWRTVSFDEINNATALKTAGQNYLSQIESPVMSIEISILDLSQYFAPGYPQPLRLLDKVHVLSPIHNIDAWYRITKMTTDIFNPESSRITLNKNMRLPISRSVANLQNK